MMTNLFSSFDPINSMNFSMLSFCLFFNIFFFFTSFWYDESILLMVLNGFLKFVMIEVISIKLNFNQILIYISLFVYVFSQNFMGLMPYVFTCSSHISINLGMSSFFIYIVVFKNWCKSPLDSLSMLVPFGTPSYLVFIMVLIETISDWIRPLTLSVRLTANLTAGHLILSLVSGSLVNFLSFLFIPTSLIYFFMIILEFMIAIIQSYVYTLLFLMYSKVSS
uniref:ATP synthase F0 subunit 6 n=1 Tax=Parasacculina yatsui TaxID=2836420 RepID=UPI002551CBC7|nr:ATP synthase F0 subunit 6 [Parasacculina yatsui]WGU20847.1 ATP synthase F0 subunit 6 [Parasacculina yatsui]